MASTPIYNWPTPDNTGLVKNGALDMRTLGNAIDTTMATMTPKSLVDAKGDLIAATANDTPARLAVGNNGEVLVADSTTSTGLRYTAGTVQSNPVLNSAMQVWQRGTSFTAATTYTADRWYKDTNTGRTVSRQVTGDTTNLPNIQYCLRYQRDSGNTLTTSCNLTQSMETVNSIPFAGKTVTLSFYARKGANFSNAASELSYFLVSGTGTDQNQRSGYTGQALPIQTTAVLTTTWQRFSATATIASTATELATVFEYIPVGTAGAADYYEITGVQIDIGSVALPFRTYAGTIQGELAACQRYYYRQSANSTNVYQRFSVPVGAASSTAVYSIIPTPVTMRTTYSSIDYTTTGLAVSDGAGSFINVTSLAVDASSAQNLISVTVNVASGLTTNRPYYLLASNSSVPYLGLNAEL